MCVCNVVGNCVKKVLRLKKGKLAGFLMFRFPLQRTFSMLLTAGFCSTGVAVRAVLWVWLTIAVSFYDNEPGRTYFFFPD